MDVLLWENTPLWHENWNSASSLHPVVDYIPDPSTCDLIKKFRSVRIESSTVLWCKLGKHYQTQRYS